MMAHISQLKISTAALAAFIILPPQAVFAEDAKNGFSVGLVGIYGTDPYVGENDEVTALPIIEYRAGRFSIGTQGLSYEVFQSEQLSFSTGITPRFSALADVDVPELAGIERDITADAFLGLTFRLGNGLSADATLRQEITGEHEGQEFQIELGYDRQLGQLGLSFAAGAKWQSEELATYTWGVMPNEANTSTRPAYVPGDLTIPYLSISAVRPINENWVIIGNLQAEFLPSEVTNSPIVDEDNLLSVALGVSYQFKDWISARDGNRTRALIRIEQAVNCSIFCSPIGIITILRSKKI